MGLKFSNFGKATVSSAPSGTSGLSFSVAAGTGLLFHALGADDYFYGIFKDASGNREIVKIEARSTDSMTIATGGRGLDGTTARTWAAGDYFVAGICNIALDESLGNANLQAIGALTSAADQLPYFTGSGTAALVGLSSFVRTLLDDADGAAFLTTLIASSTAATARATLGALASSAVSAFGLTLIGDADDTTARNTLGVSYGPAFRAAQAVSQSLTSATITKIDFGTEEFDTNSNFASSRFTPTVAGYYQINWGVSVTGTSMTDGYTMLYLNGSEIERGTEIAANSGSAVSILVSRGSGLVRCNGSTDYVEVYAKFTGSSLSAGYNRFSGCLLRPL